MGKGDKKSRRGKIILGSFGVRRPKHTAGKVYIKPEKNIETFENAAAPPPIVEKIAESIVLNQVENPEMEAVGKTEETRKVVKKAPKKPKETPEA